MSGIVKFGEIEVLRVGKVLGLWRPRPDDAPDVSPLEPWARYPRVVAPGHPGAALRNPLLVQLRQATRGT